MGQLLRTCSAVALLGICSALVVLWTRGAAFSQDSAEGKKKPAPAAKEKPDLDLSKFMRRKLDASNQILEGLVTEDTDLIVKGAKTLAELSAAEKFQVHHDVIYKQCSNEFQKVAKSLVETAEKENFDGATLKWIDTTMKCIECHKVARGLRIAGGSK
jgi:hypothetical protein